jgi:hypothetical protein
MDVQNSLPQCWGATTAKQDYDVGIESRATPQRSDHRSFNISENGIVNNAVVNRDVE